MSASISKRIRAEAAARLAAALAAICAFTALSGAARYNGKLMRLAWATDVHLNFVSGQQIAAFAKALAADELDAVVLSGDISEAPTLREHVLAVEAVVQRPLVRGDYRQAIDKAKMVISDRPSEAWLIIGTAACKNKNSKLANDAFPHRVEAGLRKTPFSGVNVGHSPTMRSRNGSCLCNDRASRRQFWSYPSKSGARDTAWKKARGT